MAESQVITLGSSPCAAARFMNEATCLQGGEAFVLAVEAFLLAVRSGAY